MHLTNGQLKAYFDRELKRVELERLEPHLAACPKCQERAQAMSSRSRMVAERLAILEPPSTFAHQSQSIARSRLRARILEQENTPMFKKLFARQYRLAWVALGVVSILAVALAFPGVRAIANNFLGLFRVQRVTVVQVNPGDLPEQLGSSSQFEYILSNDVQVEKQGEIQEVADAAEANALAGISVRLPTGLEDPLELMVQPGARVTFEVDLELIKALLQELGQEDVELPAELDGSKVTMDLPTAVAASLGKCRFEGEADREPKLDPDSSRSQLANCVTLVQMRSPTISAPPGLDIAQIGEAFLQVMGMTPEEAAQFSRTVDWTTTLVIPIPRHGTDYREVTVDSVEGTLIQQNLTDHDKQYLLLWVKDGILYALTGQGTLTDALEIANSLK